MSWLICVCFSVFDSVFCDCDICWSDSLFCLRPKSERSVIDVHLCHMASMVCLLVRFAASFSRR